MVKLYVQTLPPPDLNKNTEWFMYPDFWTTYIFILFFSWLLVLSFFGCSTGMAWTVVNLFHFATIAGKPRGALLKGRMYTGMTGYAPILLFVIITLFVLFINSIMLGSNFSKVTTVVWFWGWIGVSLVVSSLTMFYRCSRKQKKTGLEPS